MRFFGFQHKYRVEYVAICNPPSHAPPHSCQPRLLTPCGASGYALIVALACKNAPLDCCGENLNLAYDCSGHYRQCQCWRRHACATAGKRNVHSCSFDDTNRPDASWTYCPTDKVLLLQQFHCAKGVLHFVYKVYTPVPRALNTFSGYQFSMHGLHALDVNPTGTICARTGGTRSLTTQGKVDCGLENY